MEVGQTEERIRKRKLRVQINGPLIHLPCLDIRLFRIAIFILQPLQEGVIGLHVVRVFTYQTFLLILC